MPMKMANVLQFCSANRLEIAFNTDSVSPNGSFGSEIGGTNRTMSDAT